MATIASIKSNHNSQIRVQTAQDSIAQTTVADLLDAITDEHALRGCPTVANTTALATLPNTETKMVYVSNVGHFFDTGVGPADGNLIFSGVAGRFWKLIIPDKVKMQLDQVNNTTDLNKPISTATAAALANKVTVVPGKQLSTEDYTTAEKGQLASVVAVFGSSPDGDSVVNKITEVLAVFNTYPEGADIATQFAAKANLAGGATFTGDIVVPDQLVADDTSKAANTKFVHDAIEDFDNTANNNLDLDVFEGREEATNPGGVPLPRGHADNPWTVKPSLLGGGGGPLDSVPTNGSTNGVESNGVFDALATKQDTLVSGTNIKTINGTSILGAGDISTGAGSSDFVKISSTNVSGASSYDIDFNSEIATYKTILIKLVKIQNVADANYLRMRISADGTTFDSGASDYKVNTVNLVVLGTPSNVDLDYIPVTERLMGTTTVPASHAKAEIEISLPNEASLRPIINVTSQHFGWDVAMGNQRVYAIRVAAQITREIQIYSDVNFSATVIVYGIK